MKKVIVISTSLRHGSNSDLLADQFVEGAKAAGNEVIMAKVIKADVVCWATPIYYYEMSGQMKTLIDRMNAMYGRDYAFRDVYLLTTAADDDEQTPKRAETGLTGWIACYPESRLAGTVFCGGVNEPHAIEGNPKLQEAFELGNNIR